MSVYRTHKNDNYTTMSNAHLKDTNLSLKAVGLLSKVLSLPDDWKYSKKGLTSICKEGRASIDTALAELKQYGYLTITRVNPSLDTGGRIEYVYDFYETPNKIQYPDFQGTEIQGTENLPLLNTNILNTNNKTKLNKFNLVKGNEEHAPILEKPKKKTKRDTCLEKIENIYREYLEELNDDILDKLLEFFTYNKLDKNEYPGEPYIRAQIKKVIAIKTDKARMQSIQHSIDNEYKAVYEVKAAGNYTKPSYQVAHGENYVEETTEQRSARLTAQGLTTQADKWDFEGEIKDEY